jgi:transposase
MADSIMVGCDLHDKTMVLRFGTGQEPAKARTFTGDPAGRLAMITWLGDLQAKRQAVRVLFAYEASSRGFGLHDDLRQAGIECFVLAPTRIARSSKHRSSKNDGRDANQLLELLRGHVLAGNDLPAVWVPDAQTRDDRELVRMRLTAGDQLTTLKNQVQSLLKRNEVRRPEILGKGWTRGYHVWLSDLMCGKAKGLGTGGQAALGSLLRRIQSLETEIKQLDGSIVVLSQEDRYASAARALDAIKGVGVLTAMVFLTELGDVSRFSNRRQLAAYLGLVPSSDESGDRDNHKGHITRQGSRRVRKVLCQSTWSIVGRKTEFRQAYDRIVEKNPRRKKIAVVAVMRRLAILMWHRAVDAYRPADREPPGVAA